LVVPAFAVAGAVAAVGGAGAAAPRAVSWPPWSTGMLAQ
jgi:hypothetical protein